MSNINYRQRCHIIMASSILLCFLWLLNLLVQTKTCSLLSSRSGPLERKTNSVPSPPRSPHFIATIPIVLSKRSFYGKKLTYHHNNFRTKLMPQDLVWHRRSYFTSRPCTNRNALNSEPAKCEIKQGQMYIYLCVVT